MHRRIVAAWRELTGGRSTRDTGRRTLLAVSGGADSSALAIALARGLGAKRCGKLLVVGHVQHDLRPLADCERDQSRAAELAGRLGLAFCSSIVRVRGEPGNVESIARRERYAALVRMARAAGCAFIATAHQGDDVLETLIMRLVRGTGVRGLAAIHPARRLADGITLVRPMLGVDRAASEAICAAEGWAWCEDVTNRDEALLRNRVRARVVPVLKELSPKITVRAAALAAAAREVDRVVRDGAGGVQPEIAKPGCVIWRRRELREMLPGLVHEVLAQRVRAMAPRNLRRDGMRAGVLRRAVQAVRDARDDARIFELGGGIELRIDAARITLRMQS